MSCIDGVDEYIFGTEGSACLVALVIGIGHIAVVEVVDSDGEVVGLAGRVLAKRLNISEIVSIEDGAEHCTGQVVREVEL